MTPLRRERATDAVVLVVAWNFAIAQPLLDVLGKNPEFFVAHSSTKLDIVAMAIGLVLVAPLVLAGIITLVGMASKTAGRIAHRVTLGILVAEFALQLVKNLGGLPDILQIAIPIGFGVGAAWAWDQRANLRSLAWWFLPAPALFLVLFLASPVNGLIFTKEVAAGPGVTVGNPMPVVMIVLDEFPVISLMRPDGTLDRQAYPNFARLADRSVWFRNTTADWPNTERSVPTILTGKINTAAVPTASENPKSIFTMLGGAYTVEGWEPITKLCPTSLCGSAQSGLASEKRVSQLLDDTRVIAGHVLLPDELAKSLPPIDQSWAQFSGEKTNDTSDASKSAPSGSGGSGVGAADDIGSDPTDAVEGSRQELAYSDPPGAVADLSRAMQKDGARTVYVMHMKFPHFPWRYVPTGQQYDAGNEMPGYANNFWGDDVRLPDLSLARHLLQVRYVDTLVGQILDEMDRTGLSRKATLVVTADHGAAFEPDEPRRDPDQAVLGDIAYVPLFVSIPGQAPRVDNRPANLDDIVPTIADALDVKAKGWSWSGTSLLRAPDPTRKRVMTSMRGTKLPLSDDATERDEALARRWARHPGLTTLSDWQQLFHVGPLGSLVGSPTPESEPIDDAQVELDQRSEFDSYDPAGKLAPVMLTGTITGVPDKRDFAIALNGTVAGVGRSYGAGTFTGLVSPTYLRKGTNSIEVFMKTDDGYGSVPVRGVDKWTVDATADGGGTLANVDGTRASIAPDAVSGYVSADSSSGVTTVHGWAAPPADPAAHPVRIVVFQGRKYLGTSQTGDARADVATKLGAGYLNSGFTVAIPAGELAKSKTPAPLTTYAVFGSSASQLTVIK